MNSSSLSLFTHVHLSHFSLFFLYSPPSLRELAKAGIWLAPSWGERKGIQRRRSAFFLFFLERGREQDGSSPLRRVSLRGKSSKEKKERLQISWPSSTMTRGGGLLAAAAAASRLLRCNDGPLLRLLHQRRVLTADAAESVREERRQHHRPPLPSSADAAADADGDQEGGSASAHARRLREMEASTSRRGAARLETAAEVSARLLSEQRSGRKAPTIRYFASPSPSASLRSPAGSPLEESNDRSIPPPLRDWRDALEAAKKLDPQGDPLTDTFG